MATNGTASLADSAYTNAFLQDRPRSAQASVTNRAKRAELIASSLATYLSERALIEETYSKSLAKLSRKSIIPVSYGIADTPTSAWSAVLQRLETELEESIRLHEGFSDKLESQVVGSLRNKARDGDSTLRQQEGNISHVVKNYEDAVTRLSKAQSKSSRKNDSSLQSSHYEITEAHGEWTRSGPAYLSAYQHVERSRLEAIKENLAKYETMCNDLGRERMEMAERGLVSILSWEVEEDVNAFLASEGNRRATGSDGAGLSNSQGRPSEMGQVEPAYTNPPQSAVSERQQIAPALAPSTFLAPAERESTPSIHSVQSRNSHSGKSSGGLFSSFKSKLKPGLNRNRSSSHGNSSYGNLDSSRQTPNRPEMPENGYRASREDETENLSNRAMSSDSTDYPASTTSSNNKRSSFLPGMMRRKNSVSNKPPSGPARNGSSARVGGLLSPPTEEATSPVREDFTPTPTRENNNPYDRPQSMFVNGSQLEQQQQTPAHQQSASVDAEGFSVPPANHDRSPWEANVAGASLMDDDDNMPMTSTSPKLNMDIAQSPASVSNERPEDSQAALLSVQNALQSKGPAANLNRRQTRGRRDVRQSTLNMASNDDLPLSRVVEMQQSNGTAPNSPESYSTPPTTSSAPIPYPQSANSLQSSMSAITPGRSMSVLSASSSQISPSTAAGGMLSDPTGTGLRALITESVSVLAKAGQAPRVMVTGEISLLFKGASSETVRIRLNKHEALAKTAPNTQFLQSVSGSAEEYSINTSSLASVSQGGSATVVLRYQVQVSEDQAERFVPIQVTPQWKTEATQTSLLVTYAANPSCRFTSTSASPFESEADTATLQELAFVIPVTSDGVTNVQSKPLALYSSEKKRLLWKLDDLELDSSAPHKALARFSVTSQSSPQPVAVKWKVSGKLISGISLEVVGSDIQLEETACLVQAGKYLVSN